jgi:alkylated DNA repair protein alkB family protein 7
VIRNYRETHVTSWPYTESTAHEALNRIVRRVRDLLPFSDIQTHILHLASGGEILPHIDNTSASGTHILGLSLGSPRVLKMECVDSPDIAFDVLLPSGSIYVQR